jgi:hypothetical protein
MYISLLGITNVDFDIIAQRLIRFSISVSYWRRKVGIECTVHQLFIDFKKACDLVTRKVLHSILSEFRIPRKVGGVIKMCLNETYSTVLIAEFPKVWGYPPRVTSFFYEGLFFFNKMWAQDRMCILVDTLLG